MSTLRDEYLSADMPVAYRIRVQGRIRASWVDRFDGMTILLSPETQHPAITTLLGTVPDQAALMGVFSALQELRLAIVSVECVENLAAGWPEDTHPSRSYFMNKDEA